MLVLHILICIEDVPSSYCISLFVLKIDVPALHCTSLLVMHILTCTAHSSWLEKWPVANAVCAFSIKLLYEVSTFFINHLYRANTFFSAIIHQARTFCDFNFQIAPGLYNSYILCGPKIVKLVMYVQCYGVRSLMLGLRKRWFSLKISFVCIKENLVSEVNTENNWYADLWIFKL